MPPTVRGAMITLLAEPGKPTNKCENQYDQLVSNADLKILRKIMA